MLPLSSEHSATSSPEHPALPEHASPSSTGLANDASQHPAGGPGGDAPRKSSWLRILILVLIIGGVAGFITWRIMTNKPAESAGGGGRGGRRGGGAGQIVPVSFDVATMKTIPITLSALGTVTAYNTVTLKSRVDGQITRVNFQEGQRVRRGQLLIEIDRRPYEAAVEQAKGNLTRDQANAALAQAQAARYNQLYAAGVVSKESNQTQESTAGQAVGTLAADRAAIDAAQVNLNYTRITSPIDGIVGLRQVDIGNIVSAASSTGLVVITQVQPISVIFTLPEDQLPAVFDHMRGGHKLVAEAWDRSNTNKLATGTLATVDNQIDTTTGTAKLKAVFNNADNALYPNQFVNIKLILENRPNSLVIPAAAIQTGSNGSYVYVIDRTKGQAPPAPAGGARGAAGSGTTAAGAPPAGGDNTGTAAQGGGPVSSGPGGASTSAPTAQPGAGGPGAGGTPSAAGAGSGRRRGAGAGGGIGPQTNYPVVVTQVAVDSTQGTDVIIKSGLRPGQQVVTDGTEKLQDGSRVVPRPSADMQAARQGRQAAGAGAGEGTSPDNNGDGGQNGPGAFSNGHGSDRDAAAAGGRRHPGADNAQPNDSTGEHRSRHQGAEPGANGAPAGAHRRRPDSTGATQ